jgi:hypothetical protein
MNPFEAAKKFAKEFTAGLRSADVVQGGSDYYGQSILDPRFKKEVKEQGVSLRETPAKAAGALTSRAIVDVANDGTRAYWWRWNNPFAIGQALAKSGVTDIQSPTGKAAALLAISVPATAAAGTYDITNPEEQFRPEGYAQTYSPKGAEDRRQTAQPTQELFERFFLGRTGDPLKYETAKQEIPSLTPERYGNYLNYLYQDKGLLGLGVVKATGENLQGYPEARVLGFPVTLPMAGGFVAGAAGAKLASSTGATPRQRAVRGIIGGGVGSLLGVAAGNVSNELIASANRNTLPTTAEYGVTTGKI